eukprot:258684-Pelagomonas_calceolata.AAC.1
MSIILARRLHAHYVAYANKLVATRRGIYNDDTSNNQVLEPGASSNSRSPLASSILQLCGGGNSQLF